MKIKVHMLADTIMRELEEYSDEVADGVKKAARAAARTAVKEVRALSPKDTGSYAKGWTSKVVTQTKENISIVVYNKDHYQRNHLLEKAHAIKNGTDRVYGYTKAQPHIKPAEEKANKQYEQDVQEVVKG